MYNKFNKRSKTIWAEQHILSNNFQSEANKLRIRICKFPNFPFMQLIEYQKEGTFSSQKHKEHWYVRVADSYSFDKDS